MTDPLEERVVASEVVHRGRYLEFRVDTIERADGSRATRDVVGHPGAVAVLALDDEGRLLLVRQWRVPAGRALLEIPAGTLDVHDGVTEDPDVCARRELEEETGHRATTWRRLASFWTAPGFASELMHLYLATGIGGVGEADERLQPDEDERLELRHVPLDEALGLVERGEIGDAKSILGVLWLDRLRRTEAMGAFPGAADPGTAPDPGTAAVPPGPPTPASGGPAIRLAYGFTAVELALANAALVRNQRSSRVFGLLSVAVVVLNVVTLNDPVLALIGLVLAVLFLTGGLVVPFVWWSMRSKAPLLARVEATIGEAGISSTWPGGGGTLAWQGVDRIEHGGRWFFVRSSAAATALVLPDSAFGPGEVDGFRRLALRHGFTLDGHRVDPPGGLA